MKRLLALLLFVCAVTMPYGARADEPSDELRLAAGETVTYPQSLTRHGNRYVGGVTYTVVEATVSELTDLLSDMSAYVQVLPHARDARLVGTSGNDRFVEIRQGTSFVEAAYTLRMRADEDKRRVRFWLDRSRHHDIEDAWGYFRVDPLPPAADGTPRVLLAYGILVDLGPGLMRDFFESRIQASMLTVPARLRQYAQARFRKSPHTSAEPPAPRTSAEPAAGRRLLGRHAPRAPLAGSLSACLAFGLPSAFGRGA